MKHPEIVDQIINHLLTGGIQPWMDEADRKEFTEQMSVKLKETGITRELLDSQIEDGVQKGYSPERQMAIVLEYLC